MPYPTFAGGDRFTAATATAINSGALTSLPLGVIARGLRSTDTGAIAAVETGVLRLDGIPMYSGRLYKISALRLRFDGSTGSYGADKAVFRLRRDVTGVAATTAGVVIGTAEADDQISTGTLDVEYAPGSNMTYSVLLTCVRVSGAGNVVVKGTDLGGIALMVEDLGLAPANTGVVI